MSIFTHIERNAKYDRMHYEALAIYDAAYDRAVAERNDTDNWIVFAEKIDLAYEALGQARADAVAKSNATI